MLLAPESSIIQHVETACLQMPAVNIHHLDTTLRLDNAALIKKELVFTHASKINVGPHGSLA